MKTKSRFTEEAFLFSTFAEFTRCWRSGRKSRLIIETENGRALVNFCAFLGYPDERHENPRWRRNSQPRKTSIPKKKSPRKTQRDNERAANFQQRKRDSAAASATEPGPEDSSKSSPLAASSPSPVPGRARLGATSSSAPKPAAPATPPPAPAPAAPATAASTDFSFSVPAQQENVSVDSNFTDSSIVMDQSSEATATATATNTTTSDTGTVSDKVKEERSGIFPFSESEKIEARRHLPKKNKKDKNKQCDFLPYYLQERWSPLPWRLKLLERWRDHNLFD